MCGGANAGALQESPRPRLRRADVGLALLRQSEFVFEPFEDGDERRVLRHHGGDPAQGRLNARHGDRGIRHGITDAPCGALGGCAQDGATGSRRSLG